MERARAFKESDSGIFSGHTFYVTGKVNVDTQLLRNVVTAGRGEVSVDFIRVLLNTDTTFQVLTKVPTARILAADPTNRHVVSCKEDKSVWKGFADQYPVYSTELILQSALEQQVDWDNHRVPGSSSE